jgi:hypothetical protein
VVSSPTIPPGGEGKIKVTLHTRGRKGRLAKSVTVFSDDPKTPRLTLRLDGQVEVLLAFEPSRLYLKRVAKNATLERVVRVVGKLADKAKLSAPTSRSPMVTAKVVRDDSGRQAVALTIRPGAKEQRFTSSVSVSTGLDEPKKLDLFIWGVVTPDVYAERGYVFFPPYRKKGLVRVETRLTSLSGKPFKVRKIVDPAGVIKGELLPATKGEKGRRLRLTLTRKPVKKRGKLRIELDRKDQPTLELNYGVRQSFNFNARRLRRARAAAAAKSGRTKLPLQPVRGRILRATKNAAAEKAAAKKAAAEKAAAKKAAAKKAATK